MSHNNSKKIRQELESIQEQKEMAEEAKAELLQHNHILNLHETDESAKNFTANSYVKNPEDMDRIKNNTWNSSNIPAKNTQTDLSSPVAMIFDMQFKMMQACMNSWSEVMDILTAPQQKN